MITLTDDHKTEAEALAARIGESLPGTRIPPDPSAVHFQVRSNVLKRLVVVDFGTSLTTFELTPDQAETLWVRLMLARLECLGKLQTSPKVLH